MPRKKKESIATARYAELKAKWAERRNDPNYAGSGDWLVDKPELALDAVPFLQTLRTLGNLTQDPRCADLHQAIMRSELVDLATGKWSRYGTAVANPATWDMWEMIEDLISQGTSERLAIAEAVAELAIGAQSFDAACKSVKRVLDECRKFLRQKPV
ncbi:hypothetical protein [Bradyrhizobium lablabi]|uniref:hypothetical protein n=1 Tax=Bradyrhizobium lablabi TaxID=722472 RepID=UPI001BA8577B|nr:hypothetical protein [Bradyrhizobium lablabi]MBR0695135.1 hypothetical protein [Bradyrhizobium lablabi]